MRLPSKLDLGLAILHVRMVGVREMRAAAECDEEDACPDGLWDADEETIYILKYLSPKRKREVFWHEIKHAVNDQDYWSRH